MQKYYRDSSDNADYSIKNNGGDNVEWDKGMVVGKDVNVKTFMNCTLHNARGVILYITILICICVTPFSSMTITTSLSIYIPKVFGSYYRGCFLLVEILDRELKMKHLNIYKSNSLRMFCSIMQSSFVQKYNFL